jgi:prepilin-type N-terminal cleavage/methylation domain-containing protein
MMTSTKNLNGFTLIEMVLSLSIFSLILLIAYQTVVSSSQAKLRVAKSVEQQSELRSAYRTLTNAFDSQASFIGDKHFIEFDLTTAQSPWLEEAESLRLVLTEDQRLLAYVDGRQSPSPLLSFINQAEFSYLDDDLIQLRWNRSQPPKAIQLSWNKQGELQRWRFRGR